MPSIDDSDDELQHEIAQLHLEVNHLSGTIEDLERAVRYLTNNLMDDRYHPALPQQERQGADSARVADASGKMNAADGSDADSLPFPSGHAVRGKVERLVGWLQDQAAQHANVANYGSVTEMQWWEQCGPGILNANRSLQKLRDRAASNSIDLQPIIEHAGGIPNSMLIEEVPDLASEPAFERASQEAAGEGQPSLFDNPSAAAESETPF